MRPFAIWRSVLQALMAGCLLALSAAGQTDVYPTNLLPPADQDAIQDAIDALGSGGGTVVLHGTFNFGPNDGVQIVQPNVTLMGADNATIIGGVKQNADAGVWYVIDIENVGGQIRDLTLKDFKMAGILARSLTTNPADNPIVIENNTISSTNVYRPTPSTGFSYGIYVRRTGCPTKILNNRVSTAPLPVPTASVALYARLNTGDFTVRGNTATGGHWGLGYQQNGRSVTLAENTLTGSFGGGLVQTTGGDVAVSGNVLTGPYYGALVTQTGGQCVITNNNVYSTRVGQGLNVGYNAGDRPVVISGNTIRGAMDGIAFHDLGLTNHTLPVEISNNVVEPAFTCPPGYFSDGAIGFFNNCPLNFVNNTVRVIADRPGDNPTCPTFGVLLIAWDPKNGLGQDNPPALVKNNQFEIRYPFPEQPNWSLQSCGIMLALPVNGINNVTVQSNKISGTTTRGIYVSSYCRNCLIEGNDLSGLSTWSAQMSLYGREITAQNNTLGFANRIPGYSVAMELASLRPSASLPMPYPTENCSLVKNDYRLAGLPGWSESNNGCIVLHSYADLGGLGTEVKNNLVFETGRFPLGTGGPERQVYELKSPSGLVHDNRIVGLPADGLTNPGIGQRLKAIAAHSAEMLAVFEDAMGKKLNKGTLEEPLEKSGIPSPLPSPDVASPALPATVELLGNYPNPFNPTTVISFQLPVVSDVKLVVFDMLGREVSVLVNDRRDAGVHQVTFDASNLPSGVYFYRLQAGSSMETKKLSLVR